MDSAHLLALTGAFRGRRVVIIGDVDMIADELSVRKVPLLGQTIASLINDNLSLVNTKPPPFLERGVGLGSR